MRKKIIGIGVMLVFITCSCNILAMVNEKQIDIISSNYDPLEGGWVELIDGVKILHVSGSYYDMGYQHGHLLKEEIGETIRGYYSFFNLSGYTIEDFIELWETMEEYIPQEFKDEARGLSDGSGITIEESYLGLIGSVIAHDASACAGVSAWGSSTIDGKLYHMRSYDWYTTVIIDPESGKYVFDNQCLILRKPEDGYVSLCPIIPAQIGNDGGINEKKIAVNTMLSWSIKDRTDYGTPLGIRQTMALDKASSSEEVIEIINSNKTRGWNFIVSDANVPIGYAVEQTANYSYVGTWDDPIESNKPFWEIKDVIRRGNLFIHPDCASQQRKQYYPWSFIMYLINGPLIDSSRYDPYKYWYYPQWMRYKALSNGIEDILGSINLENSMSMLRSVYRGETLNVLSFKMPYIFSANTAYQWVACPETGDFAVSFSSGLTNAHESDVHYFNLYDLMESEPP